jgi:acetyltransferase-like isoleucine patch superfamily enzyme
MVFRRALGMKKFYRRLVFKLIFEKSKIFSKIRVLKFYFNPDIQLGRNVYIESNVKLSCEWGGKIKIGNDTILREGVLLKTYGNDIIIGNDCSVNPYTVIYGQGRTVIGDHVLIAAHTVIVSQNHSFERNKLIRKSGSTEKGITIEDNVWIAAGCKILDGVTLQEGTIIAAGAVVNKSTEKYSIWGGVPAKKIKTY